MEPESLGRKLGVGVRVASRMLGERAAKAADSSQVPSSGPARAANPGASQIKQRGRNLAHASKRFGEAVWGPFVHVSGVLWLEITGLFFALFTLFFAQNVYRFRAAYRTGAEHQRFLLYVVLTILFGYFTLSSFYRARRRGRGKKK